MSEGALDVLFDDNHLLVVRKPAGEVIVADSSGDRSLHERARAWVERTYDKPGRAFLGVVHRLDRPVSGVVVFARTSKAGDRLTAQFRERTVAKTYLAVTERPLAETEGEVVHWLVKKGSHNVVRWSTVEGEGAKLARTRYRVLAPAGRGHLVELTPETGRSHQLRVAMASLGAPLVGDLKYGASAPLPDRSVALHAARLELDHPTRDERLTFEAGVPELSVWDVARATWGEGR